MREIYCDESGYEGEKLIDSRNPLFAHASVHLDAAAATEVLAVLRSRIKSPAPSYRTQQIMREKSRPVLRWFLGDSSPLYGNASVFLLDKSEWVATRLAELLDLDPARIDRSPYVLSAANDMLRGKDRPGVVDEFFRVAGLTEGRERAELFRQWLLADPILNSVLDPLAPALAAAGKRWGPVTVIHDRQTMLPERRIDQLKELSSGLIEEIRFTSVDESPQIQIADMLAGAIRWIAEHPDRSLTPLAEPYAGHWRQWNQIADIFDTATARESAEARVLIDDSVVDPRER